MSLRSPHDEFLSNMDFFVRPGVPPGARAKITGVGTKLFDGANFWRCECVGELDGNCRAFTDIVYQRGPEAGDACAGLVSHAGINDAG